MNERAVSSYRVATARHPISLGHGLVDRRIHALRFFGHYYKQRVTLEI